MDESAAYLLSLLPIMAAVIPSMLSGRILSSEFKNRTVFLTFPLPVSRTTFYFGKFLASFILSAGIFGLVYGFALICGSNLYEPSFPNNVLSSFLICITAVFAVAATAYGLSTMFRRGSVGLTAVLMIVIPFLIVVITETYFDLSQSAIDHIKMLPPFGGYQALHMIDAGFGGGFVTLFKEMMTDLPPYLYAITSMLWGAAFLALGALKINKKEL
jgi:ABC-type transport system involved in multi-copper enzyme maturation permease subunit